MKARLTGWGLLLLLLVGLGLWLRPHIRWTDRVEDTGFGEAAQRQPYLAAHQFLDRAGVPQHRLRGLRILDADWSGAFPRHDGAIFLFDAYGMLSARRAQRLLDWVREGGQLVMAGENPYLDFSRPRPDPVFQHLDVIPAIAHHKASVAPTDLSGHRACDRLHDPIQFRFAGDSRNISVAIPGIHLLQKGPKFRAATLADSVGTRFAQFIYGKGRITLLASSAQWRNPYLSCLDNAYFLWELTPAQGAVWWLVNERGPSLWHFLWQSAPLLILVLLALAFGGLWFQSVRFGPVRPEGERAHGNFRQHLYASGRFLWRRGHQEALLAPLRAAIRRQASRQLPVFSALSEEKRMLALARLADLDPAVVAAAMTETPLKEERFTALMKVLATIRKQLWSHQ